MFKFRIYHILVLLIVIVFAIFNSGFVGGRITNDLEDNVVVEESYRVFVSKFYSLTTCELGNESIEFKSYGLPSSGVRCVTDKDCFDFWPAGPSVEAMDRSFCCSSGAGAGECGEDNNKWLNVTNQG